jgi:hypothetical protein
MTFNFSGGHMLQSVQRIPTRVASLAVGSAICAAVLLGIAGCSRAGSSTLNPKMLPPAPNSKCKVGYVAGNDPIPLSDDVDEMTSHQKGCLSEVARAQSVVPVPMKNDQPQTVAGSDLVSCPTTTVRIAQYNNAGVKDSDAYGDGGTKQRGYIVARIINDGNCTTAAPFSIPPKDTLLWIVDRKHDDQVLRSHLVFIGREKHAAGKSNWNIQACHHPAPTGDGAQIKKGDPCLDSPWIVPTGGTRGVRFGFSLRQGGGVGAWMACGGDCCYTNAPI